MGTMIQIGDHAELVARCGDDTLCRWAAQGLDGRCRAWRSSHGRAVAVAGPGLATRDRLAVRGPHADAVTLVGDVLDLIGPSYRPLGEHELIGALVEGIPALGRVATFGWMDRWRPAPPAPRQDGAEWLPDAALPEVDALLRESFPESLARPGIAGVQRWAGVRDASGRLVATGALAWSAPDVALIAGIAVHPDGRGHGLGRRIGSFVVAEALHKHEAAALMVEEWNHTARRLYRGLGMRYRAVAAAAAG
jgi:GNAT superfamily N-acetyltransferase